MKKRAEKGIIVLLLFALLLSLAACGKGADEGAPAPEETVSPTPAEPADTGESAEPSTEPPAAQLRLDALPAAFGENAVSDGEFVFFTISDDDPTAFTPTVDGLYRAELSLENPVRLARGECRSLTLSGDTLYFILEDVSGVCSICAVDKQGTAIRRIVRDVEGAESLSLQNGRLYFVQQNALCIVDDMETGSFSRYQPSTFSSYYQVLQTQQSIYGDLWFSGLDVNNGRMLFTYVEAEEKGWGVAGIGSRFAAAEDGAVYYLFERLEQPEYEDERQIEYVLMQMRQIGEPAPTENVGRFSGDLFPYGQYLLYTKYTEVDEKAGKDPDLARKLYCYDTQTGEETRIDRDEFIGFDISIRGIAGGRLFYNAYEYGFGAPGEIEFVGCYSCDLTGEGAAVSLRGQAESAVESVAVQADDVAVEEFMAERERQREEELRNTPYGPGTSTLYLTAGNRAACYRLVRLDGTTQFMVLLEPGTNTTQSFPCGKYILKVARGETWISDEEAFGPGGSYSTTNVFEFESGGAYEISTGTQGSFTGDSQAGFTG